MPYRSSVLLALLPAAFGSIALHTAPSVVKVVKTGDGFQLLRNGKSYTVTYEKSIAAQPLCLGSYAFTWGSKQEATATWFGLLLPDGSRLGATDALARLWTGKPSARLCPAITALTVAGSEQVVPGAIVKAALAAADAQKNPLTVQWVLQADAATYHI